MTPEQEADVLRWMRYAVEDLGAARLLADNSEFGLRHVCVQAQQAAEKALKAALLSEGIDPLEPTTSTG